MTGTEAKIKSMLFRKFCPDSTELGEYHLGMLSKDRAALITQHLGECSHCTRELGQLQDFLGALETDIEAGLADRIKIWIAELLTDKTAGSPGFTPAFGLRGEPERSLSYQAGDAQLTLEIQEDTDMPGRSSILGLVTGIDLNGLEVFLLHAGQRLVSAIVDDLGNFILPGLSSGQYDLILSGPGLEIHIPALAIE